MVPFQPCMTHLANAQSFVGKWANKSYEHDILRKLTEIDESIRNRWAETFRASDAPLGVAMDEADNLAKMLWQSDVPLIPKAHGNKGGGGWGSGKGNVRKDDPKLGSASFIDKVKGNGKEYIVNDGDIINFLHS